MLKDVTILPTALTDVETAFDYLRVFEHDDVPHVTRAINHATGMIERVCSRKLKSRAMTIRVNGPRVSPVTGVGAVPFGGSGSIYLPEWPLTALTSAESTADNVTFTALNTSGWIADEAGLLILPNDFFPVGNLNIRLTGDFGYKAGTHDEELADLERACLRLVEIFYQDWKNAVGRATTIGVGGNSSTLSYDLPPDVDHAIARFKRVM